MVGDRPHPVPAQTVGEYEWPVTAESGRVASHHCEVGTRIRRDVHLADHQQAGVGDPWPTLAGDLVALADCAPTVAWCGVRR
ncbi:hypothetical protein GCM10027162_52230 [Streptomyces incanus]